MKKFYTQEEACHAIKAHMKDQGITYSAMSTKIGEDPGNIHRQLSGKSLLGKSLRSYFCDVMNAEEVNGFSVKR